MKVHCKYDELLEILKVKEDPNNRNQHTQEEIRQMAKVLEYQGWRAPLVISKETGLLKSGHKRLKAAILNRWFEVPIVHQSFDTSDMEFSYGISDNALGQASELDYSGINDDLQHLDGINFDMDYLGLQSFEIEPADKKLVEKERCKACGMLVPKRRYPTRKNGKTRKTK